MSLLIARRWGAMIVIVGDTNLSDSGGRQGVLHGVVKSRIFSPHLCASFNGNLRAADAAFDEIARTADPDPQRSVAILARIHRESGQAVEFIVASSQPEPALIEIKQGGARPVEQSWLGSPAANAAFEVALPSAAPINTAAGDVWRLPEGTGARTGDYAELVRRMRGVIATASVPGTGGFVVPVAIDKGRFTYMHYATTIAQPISLDLLPADQPEPAQLGTAAARGGDAFSLVGSESGATLGIYTLQSRSGATYRTTQGVLRPRLYAGISPLQFEELSGVRTMFDVVQELIKRALLRMQSGNFDGALGDAELAIARSSKREPEPYRCRGSVHAARGMHASAVADLSAAIALDPDNAPTLASRGRSLAMLGKLGAAERDFTKAIATKPDYVAAYRWRAEIARRKGDLAKAAEDDLAAARISSGLAVDTSRRSDPPN